jgi:hypothetical protein
MENPLSVGGLCPHRRQTEDLSVCSRENLQSGLGPFRELDAARALRKIIPTCGQVS